MNLWLDNLTIDMPADLHDTERWWRNNFTSTKRKYVEC